jgi:serine/threonine-protein kinase RsbW
MKMTNEFNISFYSQISLVKDILNDISVFLTKSIGNLSLENKSELKLIFSELLCNAVIHGNKSDPTKLVNIYIEVTHNNVYAVVKDEGSGFDYLDLLSRHRSGNSLLNENGRGLWLVYSLSDSLAFNIAGNEIKFYKRVSL